MIMMIMTLFALNANTNFDDQVVCTVGLLDLIRNKCDVVLFLLNQCVHLMLLHYVQNRVSFEQKPIIRPVGYHCGKMHVNFIAS